MLSAPAFYSSLAVGIVLSVLGAIFIQPLLRVFGATPDILAEATLYGRVIIGGSVFLFVNMTLNNLLGAEGTAGHSSLGQLVGAVLNIILDPIFIFVLDMGITGAVFAASQQGLYLIPMVLLLPPLFGVNGVFMAQPAGFVLAFLTGLILMKRSYTKLEREEGFRS